MPPTATLAVAVLVAASSLLAGAGCTATEPADDLGFLLAGHRPFVARLSIADEHRDCGERPPLCEAALRPGEPRFRTLVAASSRSPEKRDGLHPRGLARLLAGAASGEVGEAISLLEKAQERALDDAEVASDLAAAYLIQAEPGHALRLRIEALGWADHALDLDSGSLPALFNRALALDSIPLLREQAVEAWARYEAAEPDPAWRGEAALRRRRIERPTGRETWEQWHARLEASLEDAAAGRPPEVPGRFSQQVRLWLEDRLLPAWGAAVEAGDEAAAARRLALADALAAMLETRGAGSTLRGSLKRIAGRSSKARRIELARAHRLYGDARVLHERQDYQRAAAPFRESAALFERSGSPFAAWPRFQLVYLDAYAQPPDFEAALRGLEELRGRFGDSDPVYLGYLEYMTGYLLAYRGDHAAALRAAGRAAEHFTRSGELENLAAMHYDSAFRLRRIGEARLAWERWSDASHLSDHMVKSRRLQNLTGGIAVHLQEEDEPRLALRFLDAWVREAERSGNPMSRALAHCGRAHGLARLERVDEALEGLRLAFEAAAEITDRGVRTLARIDVAVEEADVLRLAGRLDEALATLERAQGFLERIDAPLKLVDLLRHKAAIERQQGRGTAALTTLTEAEAAILRLRSLLDDSAQRIAYLDRLRVVMEDRVGLLIDLGRGEEAFTVAERMRAPELVGALQRRAAAAGFAPEEVARASRRSVVAPGVVVVSFLSLPERLVAWVLRGESLETSILPLPRADLGRQVEAVMAELRRPIGDGAYRPGLAARGLASLLLPPAVLEGRQRLLVVPDGPLHQLSFPALADPAAEEHLLIERLTASVAISLTAGRLLNLLEDKLPAPAGPALLVDVPDWDRRAFPELPSLTRRVDPASLRALLGPLVLLSGPAATAEAFLLEYPRHGLVYFAGHSLAATQASSRGGLVLAPDGPGDDGLLEAQEIAPADLPATRLVVLGSCSGAGGPVSPTEGALSLVRPFLAAGTPAVVASLDAVEDVVGHALFMALVERHRGLDDAAELLRQSQLALRRSMQRDDGLLFQVYGSARGIFVR